MKDAHIGEHMLTGGSSAAATKSAAGRAQAASSPMELGMALHSLGDSFSHRERGNEGRMSSSPLGHPPGDYASAFAHGSTDYERYTVDNLATRPDVFQAYAGALYDQLVAYGQRTGAVREAPLSKEDFLDHMKALIQAAGTDNAQQVSVLKQALGCGSSPNCKGALGDFGQDPNEHDISTLSNERSSYPGPASDFMSTPAVRSEMHESRNENE